MGKLKSLPLHPLQSAFWGEFRKKTGVSVIRLAEGFQMTIHQLPLTSLRIGYLPKCRLPDREIIKKLIKTGKRENCIFIKLEPNVIKTQRAKRKGQNDNLKLKSFNIRKSPHPLFSKYTFQIDLTKNEEELLGQMKAKTRYNVRLAQRKGVYVKEETSKKAFETYLRLLRETWRRQKFYSHDENYHRLMWETLRPAGIAHLLLAYYQKPTDKEPLPLVAWMLFLYRGVLYYPYGGSLAKYRNVMASNLMMWEAIRWGKKKRAKIFDLWGCLGPQPEKNNPWYGFHRFKEGYGGELVEFLGSYDLVLNPFLYQFYSLVYPLRQKLLRWI